MKSRFFLCFLFVVCFAMMVFAICNANQTISQINPSQETTTANLSNLAQSNSPIQSLSSEQTQYSNQNNNLTLYSLFIAVLGILIGIITTIGVTLFTTRIESIKEFKSNIRGEFKEQKESIKKKTEELIGIKKEIDKKTTLIDDIQKWQDCQNRYLQKINQYLFSITNSIVDNNQKKSKKSSDIRKILWHDYHIINLFFPLAEPTTKPAFDYIKANGTIEDIPDLEFIAKNDPDENKKRLAIETIGFIKAKEINPQT